MINKESLHQGCKSLLINGRTNGHLNVWQFGRQLKLLAAMSEKEGATSAVLGELNLDLGKLSRKNCG